MKRCNLERKGKTDISSLPKRINISPNLNRGELATLLLWNTASKKRRRLSAAPPASLSGFLRYQHGRWSHRWIRLDPDSRARLGVLWRQLGIDAVEALFGRGLLTLDRAALAEIT